MFGEREKMRIAGMFDPNIVCTTSLSKSTITYLYYRSLRKYFVTQMKMDFFELGGNYCGWKNGRYFRVIPKRTYNEFYALIMN